MNQDTTKPKNVSSQENDHTSAYGHMPNPDQIQSQTTLERAKEMGLYTEATEEEPEDIDVAEEYQEQEKKQ